MYNSSSFSSNTFQKPVWVTEWACQVSGEGRCAGERGNTYATGGLGQNFNDADEQCSLQDVVDFMNATQQFMDDTDWVERYAWFGAMEDMQGVNTVSRPVSPLAAARGSC